MRIVGSFSRALVLVLVFAGAVSAEVRTCPPHMRTIAYFVGLSIPVPPGDCSSNIYYPNGNTAFSAASGNWYYQNGNTAFSRASGNWYFQNGNTAFSQASGNWYYENGNTAYSHASGNWYYSSGNTAFSKASGNWYYSNGNTAYSKASGRLYYENGNLAGTFPNITASAMVNGVLKDSPDHKMFRILARVLAGR